MHPALQVALNILVAFSPVLVFLQALYHLDSFKLVRFSRVMWMVAAGGALAIAAWALNGYAIARLGISFKDFSRFVAPTLEEVLKASALAYLFTRNRIGFRVDAAIMGFAIGAGFSIAENSYLLHVLEDANIAVWIIRGFGTAMMHGGATAIVAVATQTLIERRAHPLLYAPALGLAILLHTVFNYFPDEMVLTTVGAFIVLPIIHLMIFARSEHAVHTWLKADYESHEQMLADIESGEFVHQEGGRFITAMAGSLPNATVDDVFNYVKLHTLLLLRAERVDLAQEKGERVVLTADDDRAFDRLHALERKIGRSAMIALRPHLKINRKQLFELYQLELDARATPD